MTFTKMQGIGNDFVMLDTLQGEPLPDDLAELSRTVTDRRRSVGGDGLILVERGEQTPFRMRMFNPDGSESEMCGNGIRCVAVLLRDHGHLTEPSVEVETGAGILSVTLVGDDRVEVNMGQARLSPAEIGMKWSAGEQFVDQKVGGEFVGTAVSMGNPHLVIFVDDLDAVELDHVGPILEQHPFFPDRVNVHFATVIDRAHLAMKSWERGAGATLACGTGACSVGVAGFVTSRSDRAVDVRLPGGTLHIHYLEDGNVRMTGPGTTVFTGSLEAPPEA